MDLDAGEVTPASGTAALSPHLLAVVAGVALLAAAGPRLAAAADLGLRGGYYADAGKPFLGAEVVFRVSERVQIGPGVDVLDVDEGHFVNASVDVLYQINCACNPTSLVWAGAGPALISEDDGTGSRLKPGLDLLLGFGFRAGPVVPYTQVKAVLKDAPEVAFAVGLRF